MLYFNPNPNFTRLSKYYKFSTAPEILHQQYPNGYPIQIDWYYTDEMVEDILKRFWAIIEKYNLLKDGDNLMYLILNQVNEIENIITAAIEQNNALLRAKELAGLLIAYHDVDSEKTPTISIKGQRETYKISDQPLSQWIGSLISEKVLNGNLPIQLMHMFSDFLFIDKVHGERSINFNKVLEIYNRKVQNTNTYIKQLQNRLRAEFCFYLRPYLNGETILKKAERTNFSDEQLTFFYEVLVLFELLNAQGFDKSMGYEAKDFMRNTLTKYAKMYGIKETKKV
ncbi:hypothetical protein [uncultured Mucilaginibacter sp.]|uniref:hypothetical protein n=1 Tax=uncultured Mucilaginibacter sp. TaxID=797541 RepID=UPI0025F26930|nr:hypothetical protein [uncultured Mucilaginibacter sp.]